MIAEVRSVGIAAFVMATAIVLAYSLGCGGGAAERAEGMHAVLNTVTDVVDPLSATTVIACDAAEAVVVVRRGTTQAEDEAAMAEIRGHCDRVHAAFEAVRQAQLAARAAVDLARAEGTDEAIERAMKAIGAMHETVQAARGVWETQQSVIREVIE